MFGFIFNKFHLHKSLDNFEYSVVTNSLYTISPSVLHTKTSTIHSFLPLPPVSFFKEF